MAKRWLILLVVMLGWLTAVAAQDSAEGEIRFVQIIYEQADLYIDDVLTVPNVAFTVGTDFTALPAGTHTLAVARAGETAGVSTTLEVEAGHQYTLVTFGEYDSDAPTLTVIDQTSAFADYETGGNSAIIIQNVPSAIPVDVWFEDELKIENLTFGSYGTANAPLGQFGAKAVVVGEPLNIAFESVYFAVPNTVSLAYLSGTFPDAINRTFFTTTPDNLHTYLTTHTGLENSKLTTFFGLLQSAGLDSLLDSETPYTVFAPTNDAFAAVTLPDDATAAADWLRYHIVEGHWGPYELTGEHTLTSLQGGTLTTQFQPVEIPLNVNGVPTGLQHRTSNGVIYLIESVLTPAA